MEIDARLFTPPWAVRKLRSDRDFEPLAAVAQSRAASFNGDGGDWDTVRDRLADRWPIVTEAELDATHGRADLVAALLQAKLSYAHRLAEESTGHPLRPPSGPKAVESRPWRSMLGLSALTMSGLLFALVLYG